jgi:hypothetical protein
MFFFWSLPAGREERTYSFVEVCKRTRERRSKSSQKENPKQRNRI